MFILGVMVTAGAAQAQQAASNVLLSDKQHNVEITRGDIEADA